MLPPMMGYEAGRGRELELEQKIAARRQLEEALSARRLEQPSLLEKLVESLRNVVAVSTQLASSLANSSGKRWQQPTSATGA